MYHLTIYFPLLLYVYQRIVECEWTNRYTSRCFKALECEQPIQLLMTMIVIHIVGFEYLSHYEDAFVSCLQMMSPLCEIFGVGKLRMILGAIVLGMPTWKLLLLQRRIIISNNGTQLCQDGQLDTLFLDWTDLTSFSEKREGAECGHNKRYKGKPCYKLLLSLLGKIFIDLKLCPGKSNPKVHFKKMVKRAIAMGYKFTAVCADAAFGYAENVLFAVKLSLHYAIGASSQLNIIKDGREHFKKLARRGSSRIISIKKGLSAFDFGWQYIGRLGLRDVYTRVIICRRIHRKRKKGKLKVRTYYYAILTDLDFTVPKIVKFYHQRQNIENGIKELKYHYFLNRVPHEKLKANEFYIATKLFAMAMLKLFAFEYLPKSVQNMRRTTLIRKVFTTSLLKVVPMKYPLVPIRVETRPASKYSWHFKRIIPKLLDNHSRLYANKLAS